MATLGLPGSVWARAARYAMAGCVVMGCAGGTVWGARGETNIAVNAQMPARGEQVTVVGVYFAAGNGVECPKIETDDGRVFGVSSVPTDITIGTRVEVSGPYVVMTTCLGEVVYAEELRVL